MSSLTPSEIENARAYHHRRSADRRREREELRRSTLRQVREAIRDLVRSFEAIEAVYLFGSILRPHAFARGSDIDIALVSRDPEQETRFARRLEGALERDVDIRAYEGAVRRAVAWSGEVVYER
jgi:predicted nucleotidyltransferase